MVVPLPIPHRCIWCLRQGQDVPFDLSHVVPECAGNDSQVLPEGLVCRGCNNYFGTKVEPVLLADPIFHLNAVVLRMVDPGDMHVFRDKVFDDNHPPVEPIVRNIAINAELGLRSGEMIVEVDYQLRGRLVCKYDRRKLAFLSRAIHKIAFESLAWTIFVKGLENPPDLFDQYFEPTRAWARHGQPQNAVRPVLRRNSGKPSPDWGSELLSRDQDIVVSLRLLGDWFVVNVTSKPNEVLEKLVANVDPEKRDGMLLISDRLGPPEFNAQPDEN